MSFFGFDQRDLEKDKQAFLDGRRQSEDVAVYTWGEESYDGLGDALQEGGDELNDETFGSVGQVGAHHVLLFHFLDTQFILQALTLTLFIQNCRVRLILSNHRAICKDPPNKPQPHLYGTTSLLFQFSFQEMALLGDP